MTMNNPYKMPEGEVENDFQNLDLGLYIGKITTFAVHENKPLIFMMVKPETEVTLINPDHKKSMKNAFGRYDPPNLKKIGPVEGDQDYRISLFIAEEESRYPKYYTNAKGELHRLKKGDKANLPVDGKMLTQRDEVMVELSQMFNLGGKDIPSPAGAEFQEAFAVFLDEQLSGSKIIFQAKSNGEYTNYVLKRPISEEQIAQIKGR